MRVTHLSVKRALITFVGICLVLIPGTANRLAGESLGEPIVLTVYSDYV